MKAADDQVKAEEQADAGPIKPGGEMVTTAVHIPKATLSLLRRVAVARNSAVVPRSAWGSTQLRDGDVVEVLAAVAGG